MQIVFFPDENGATNPDVIEGKFVQLTLGGREVLVFAPRALDTYHNQILARLCQHHGLRHRWLNNETLQIQEPTLRVIGGGRFRIDARSRALRLWDSSQAYGRFDEDRLQDKIAAAGHDWSGFNITIE